MKKRILCLSLVLMLSLLSGCACAHEWTDADCLNPQICTKCEEIGAEALGHDWAAATCEQAETCRRCGETQGKLLAHTYGDWTFGETDMTHTCLNCGAEETTELDREIYLETLLAGYWECYGVFQENSFYSPYWLSKPGDALLFGDDHSVSGSVNLSPVSSTWEFREYFQEEDEELYYFGLLLENGKMLSMLLSQRAEEDILYIFYNETDQVLLTRNDAVADALAGSWGAKGSSGMCSLTLNPDRTVSGNIDGEFEGTWQLMPVQEQELIGSYCGMYICFERNGEEIQLKATATAPYSYGSGEPAAEFDPETISITYNGTRLEFSSMTQEEIAAQTKAMEEGPNMILGTWSSIYWRKLGSGSTPAMNESLLGYSITFYNDNTFTASVGRDISGTWVYRTDGSFTHNETSGSHAYVLQINGEKKYYQITLRYWENQMSQLIFQNSAASPGDSKSLYFGKLSERDDQMIRSLVGTWTSVCDDINIHATDEHPRTYTMEYHFTIQEDGTYTGHDGTNVSGTWNLQHISYESDGSHSYYFDLYDTNSEQTNNIIIYDNPDHDNSEINVDYRVTTTDYQRWISIKQFTQEKLDAAHLGPTLPIGEWTSQAVTYYGENGDGDKRMETDEYSFVVHEDGTFSAQLETALKGTWSFREYMPDSGYYYDFDFTGQATSESGYFFVSKENDFMSFRLIISDKEAFYQMGRE